MLERMWCKGNIPPLLVGMQICTICTTTLEISIAVSQKIGPSNNTLGNIDKGFSIILQDICSTRFIAALFAIARIWKQPRYPSRRMDKEKVVHLYWSTTQR